MDSWFDHFGLDNSVYENTKRSLDDALERTQAFPKEPPPGRVFLQRSRGKKAGELLVASRYHDGTYWVEFWDERKTHAHVDCSFQWPEVLSFFKLALNDPYEALNNHDYTRHNHTFVGKDVDFWFPVTFVGATTLVAITLVADVSRFIALGLALWIFLRRITGIWLDRDRKRSGHQIALKYGSVRAMFYNSVVPFITSSALFAASRSFHPVLRIPWSAFAMIFVVVGVIPQIIALVHLCSDKYPNPAFTIALASREHSSELSEKNAGNDWKRGVQWIIAAAWVFSVAIDNYFHFFV